MFFNLILIMNVSDKSIKFIQAQLENLIKVIFVSHPIDIGKFTVRMLSKDIEIFRKKLNFDFDDYVVYPGQQPRYTGDIELYKNKKLVKKISVKTAVSGNLISTLSKLLPELDAQTDGLILAVYTCTDIKTKEYKAILILIYIPYDCVKYHDGSIYYVIQNKLDDKASNENCTEFQPLAINEAIQFEYLRHALILNEKVDQSLETAQDAAEMSAEAAKKADKAYEMSAEAAKKADKIIKDLSEIMKILKRKPSK